MDVDVVDICQIMNSDELSNFCLNRLCVTRKLLNI